MTNEVATARELATHAADIDHLQKDMNKLMSDMEDVKKTLIAIQSTLSEAKGGWKMLMLLGGAGGLFGSLITQVVHNLPPWSK
jgi:hypothetical protein